ncbi:MAG: Hsp70 family protein [Candidatus Riflebacteria bacterium]|nr:Hsp70 family protein [Candidatus Riflebacteria bacterium]
MSAKISLGIDFGSSDLRAAYLHQGDLLDVPIDRLTFKWTRWIYMDRAPAGIPQGVIFPSIKERFGIDPLALGMAWGEQLTFPELMARALADLKAVAEEYSGATVGRAALTVPAGFTESRRALLRDTALHAGFDEVVLINDCTAAVIGHLYGSPDASTTELVYSMGYSGFEASIIRRARKSYRVLSTESATTPSGEFFDLLMMVSIVRQLEEECGPAGVRKMKAKDWDTLRVSIHRAKERLSVELETPLELPALLTGRSEPVTVTLQRESFSRLIERSVEESLDTVDAMLAQDSLVPADIHEILLLGGGGQIPFVQEAIARRLGRQPVPLSVDLLARGAAVHAATLSEPVSSMSAATDLSAENCASAIGGVQASARLFSLPEVSPQPSPQAGSPPESPAVAAPVASPHPLGSQAPPAPSERVKLVMLPADAAGSSEPKGHAVVRGSSEQVSTPLPTDALLRPESPNAAASVTVTSGPSPDNGHGPGSAPGSVTRSAAPVPEVRENGVRAHEADSFSDRPDTTELLRYAQRLAESGQTARAVGFLRHVIDEVEAAMATLPGTIDAASSRLKLAEAYRFLEKKQYLNAMDASHRAHQLNSDDPEILRGMMEVHRLAATAADSRASFQEAIQWLSCAHSHDQTDVSIHRALAQRYFTHARAVLHDLDDREDAVRWLERGLEWSPEDPEANELLHQLTASGASPRNG